MLAALDRACLVTFVVEIGLKPETETDQYRERMLAKLATTETR